MRIIKFIAILLLYSLQQSCAQADLQPLTQPVTKPDVELYNQGNQFLEKKRYFNAVNTFKKAIQINNQEAVYFLNLGFAQQKLSLYDDALKSYLQAVKLNDSLAEAWYNLSIIYNEIGAIAKSKYAFKKFKSLQNAP